MDWIDPRFADKIAAEAENSGSGGKASSKPRRQSLEKRTRAALAQPLEVWSAAYDHALSRLNWPGKISAESTFLWSCVLLEQAEILVRAGMSASQISGLACQPVDTAETVPARVSSEERKSVSALMSWPLESMASKWLEEAPHEADAALGLIAFAWHLPAHAQRPANTWLGPWLADATRQVAKSACNPDDAAICELVMKCELPLLLGTVTGAGKRTHFSEAFEAMDQLALMLEAAEDRPARWLAYGTSYLRAALASVLRSRILADSLGLRKFYAPQRHALARLLEHAARWARKGGSNLLGVPGLTPVVEAHWDALAGYAEKSKSVRTLLCLSDLSHRHAKRSEAKAAVSAMKLPTATYYSAEARGVCMQTDWTKRSGRLAVDFSDTPPALEIIGPKGDTLLSGKWMLQVKLDGQAQLQLEDWEEVCWFTDDDVDYLELEAKFGDRCRIQRQVMLMRDDNLVLLADALLGDQAGNWEIQSTLPLGPKVTFEAAAATRESYLAMPHKQRCLLLPLALPEWRKQLTGGKLQCDAGQLSLSASTQAQRLYSPLLISLKPAHADKPLTWRQLTVAEDLQVVPHHVAAAYRVQLGTEQWVFYRTLAEAVRRTALGMHTIHDFYAGRFDGENGTFETLVEVESENA
jgi:hypothetical protein